MKTITDKYGTIRKYNDAGELHCDDGPAIIVLNGDVAFYDLLLRKPTTLLVVG